MTRPQTYFRELKSTDLPQIREISKDIWEGHDYIPKIAQKWFDNPHGYFYGLFTASPNEDLIAFGRLGFRDATFAWMEGGRVKAVYQKQGFGIDITQHALDVAQKRGISIVQYDTHSENTGSISLAKRFGFKTKDQLFLQEITWTTLQKSLADHQSSEFLEISSNQVQSVFQALGHTNPEDVNVGWAYLPVNAENFQKLASNFLWFTNPAHSALLKAEKSDIDSPHEPPSSHVEWLSLYGDADAAVTLLLDYLAHLPTTRTIKSVEIATPRKLMKPLQTLGFHREDESEACIFLFEKRLESV